MKVIEPGHKYWIEDSENPGLGQKLSFVCKKDGELIFDGTTNEAVLEILLDRLYYLDILVPCKENEIAIIKLEEALMWLRRRTDKRIQQNVEGTDGRHWSGL